jgi:hypothetical protein
MRNFFLSFIVTISFFLMAFKVHESIVEWETPLEVQSRAIEVIMPKLEVPIVNIELKNHNSFLDKIGHYESSNNYSSVNRLGLHG